MIGIERNNDKEADHFDEKLSRAHKLPAASSTPQSDEKIDGFLPLEPAVFVFNGKPRSGKSFALKTILYKYAKAGYFTNYLAFVTTKFNSAYDFLDDKDVFVDYTDAIMTRYLKGIEKWALQNPGKKVPATALIFDDQMKRISQNSTVFLNMIATHRHFSLSIFITSQYLLGSGISTAIREMTSVALIWKTDFENSLDALYSAFGQKMDGRGGEIKKQEEFIDVLAAATSVKHRALMFIANQNTKEEAYKYYLAPEVPKFKIKTQKAKKDE